MAANFVYDVFLSHSSRDKPVVRKLAERLRADGLRVWFDEWEIQPGDMIGLKIEQGLQQSRVLVLAMSSHALGSDWVTLERHTALFRDPSNTQRRFIPMRLDDVEIPDSLRQFAYVDWHIECDEEYARLVKSCRPPRVEGRNPTLPYFPFLRIADYDEEASVEETVVPLPLTRIERERPRPKPLVGVNVDYRSSRKDSPPYCFLHAGYCNSLLKAGAVPMLIPPLDDEADMKRVLDKFDGIVFIGGADLDCRNDGYMCHPSMRLLDPRRENFDRRLMRLVAERRMPVLGVGCGMQLLNVSQGGNLFLHIPEDLPRALPHLDVMDANHRHALDVKIGTIMERVYGEGETRVNSMHHMAIDEVAPGFVVSARCPDGVIEAIESTASEWFAFGTQFHPESELASCADKRIFEEFVSGICAKSGER